MQPVLQGTTLSFDRINENVTEWTCSRSRCKVEKKNMNGYMPFSEVKPGPGAATGRNLMQPAVSNLKPGTVT